jgi:hypothetical protein
MVSAYKPALELKEQIRHEVYFSSVLLCLTYGEEPHGEFVNDFQRQDPLGTKLIVLIYTYVP